MKDYEVRSVFDPTSKWYVAPKSFDTFADAMRYAITIAKKRVDERYAPGIKIIGPDCDSEPWSVKGLIDISKLDEMENGPVKDWWIKRFLRSKKKRDG